MLHALRKPPSAIATSARPRAILSSLHVDWPVNQDSEGDAVRGTARASPGSGTIACGLAAVAPRSTATVVLWARSEARPRGRARRAARRRCERLDDEVDPAHVRVVDRPRRARRARRSSSRRSSRTPTPRPRCCAAAARARSTPDAVLATTTSSLSVERAGRAPAAAPSASSACTSSTPCRRWSWSSSSSRGAASEDTRARAHALCEALGKTAGRGARHAGLRRQPPAVPLPVQRRAAARGDRPGARRRSTRA